MNESASPEVTTSSGSVRGVRENGVAVFRGIPFAEAPVGPLRFAAPSQPAGWSGVREALAFGPPPPQEQWGPASAMGEASAGDEWLTVNVWTPAPQRSARCPVLVWVYGGAYKVGSADDPGYDGGRLARDGDLVVVTFNYRVG